MVTLLVYTFHALQPLDVSWFKPFKIVFKKERNNAMDKNNHYEPDKCTLANWQIRAWTNHCPKKYQSGFRVTKIWPLNPKAMDHKTKPSEVYTSTPINISDSPSENFDNF